METAIFRPRRVRILKPESITNQIRSMDVSSFIAIRFQISFRAPEAIHLGVLQELTGIVAAP